MARHYQKYWVSSCLAIIAHIYMTYFRVASD